MGNIFKIIINVFLLSSLTFAQAYMSVDTNGVIVTYDLSDVDSITYNSSGDTMNVDITSGSDIYYLEEVDSITFTGDTSGKTLNVETGQGLVDYALSDIDSITFMLLYYDSTGTITDIDGNVYKTVKIGDQWWMAENLKVTHYNNNDSIPNVTDNSEWRTLTSGAYCNYDNDSSYVNTYGRLYNWHAVDDNRNLAPAGWHVPSDDEWKQLEMYLGMTQSMVNATGWRGSDEGGKMKEADTTRWRSPNTGATNASGFTALPGGDRYEGAFIAISQYGYWWSATEAQTPTAWDRFIGFGRADVARHDVFKYTGYSVRCVKD